MKKQYTAKAVANRFIELSRHHNCNDMTPMKLQRLVYFTYGWSLVVFKKGLIAENIQAWQYGPVIQSIYHEFKIFGNDLVERKAKEIFFDENNILSISIPEIDLDDKETNDLINRIWEVYAIFTPIQLSNLAHEPGTPWDQVRQKCGGEPMGISMQNKLIRSYFASFLNN